MAGLNIPVDVFNDHDGVIDDHAQYEYQAEERILVDRGAGEFEQDESESERDRNADGGQQAVAQPQKHPKHEDY